MKVKIGDLTKIKTGKLDANASSEDGQYPFFTCSREPLKISNYSYDCECVLVAGNGDLNVKYYNGKFDAYQRTYIIEDNSDGKLYMPYLYYFMEDYIEELRKQAIGGVIKYIKLGNLTDAMIELPSVDEQKEIVNILDKAKILLDLRNDEISKLDDLIKARFVELFGDENNSKKWKTVNVEDVAEVQVGVVIKPSQYYTDEANGVRAFRSLNVGEGFIKNSNWVYFTQEGHQKNSKSILKENDLLIVRSGTPGTTCVVTKEYEGCNAIDIIIAHPNSELVNPYYLCAFTNMPHGKKQINEGTGGAAQQHFNVGKYNKLHLMLPPLEIQNEFVSFVHQVDKSKVIDKKPLYKGGIYNGNKFFIS
ncbi:MAG: restriction endonuclease subunit S [Lachnospiraceae bacterium]|nr:restriction endonuclease subunit S [Lachnospiraceae bacterium]